LRENEKEEDARARTSLCSKKWDGVIRGRRGHQNQDGPAKKKEMRTTALRLNSRRKKEGTPLIEKEGERKKIASAA